jgi:hypothetical protein
MSVICSVAFADRTVTRMTVWDYSPDSFDLGRALQLAHYAYESRMHRPPPELSITVGEKTYTLPDILALRYETMGGKTYDISGEELKRDLLFAMALGSVGNGPPRP